MVFTAIARRHKGPWVSSEKGTCDLVPEERAAPAAAAGSCPCLCSTRAPAPAAGPSVLGERKTQNSNLSQISLGYLESIRRATLQSIGEQKELRCLKELQLVRPLPCWGAPLSVCKACAPAFWACTRRSCARGPPSRGACAGQRGRTSGKCLHACARTRPHAQGPARTAAQAYGCGARGPARRGE